MSIFTIFNKNTRRAASSGPASFDLSKARGFTLIELIVVIAIIGLLSSIVLTALGLSRAKGEIAKVQGDYKSVANALELYRQSHSGQYPGTPETAQTVASLTDNNGPLSEYMKQTPTESSLVVASGNMNYYLNTPGDTFNRYWCSDTDSDQDYVISFTATQAAMDSGYFQPVYSAPGVQVGGAVRCVVVNQK